MQHSTAITAQHSDGLGVPPGPCSKAQHRQHSAAQLTILRSRSSSTCLDLRRVRRFWPLHQQEFDAAK